MLGLGVEVGLGLGLSLGLVLVLGPPSNNTVFPEKRREKPRVCQRSKTNKRCPFGHSRLLGTVAPAGRSLPFSVVGGHVCREPVAEAIHGSPET